MRVFIAGGSGVLGRALIPLLRTAGHEVIATTRSLSKFARVADTGATPFLLDALDRTATVRAVVETRPDAIVHLLTDLTAGDSGSNARLRAAGTRHLVDAAHEAGTSRMVAESISWIHSPGRELATESDPLDLDAPEPRQTTISAVRALECAVQELHDGGVLRFGQLYGPGTWYSTAGRFGDAARAGELPATETVTSFVHTSDAAAALLLALGWGRGTWNIVDDEPASGHEWVPRFAAAVGAPPPTSSISGDIGRPVSNAAARAAGLTLRYPSWREGFVT